MAQMKKLDEEEQEPSQEEMETRFEREKRECVMVTPNGMFCDFKTELHRSMQVYSVHEMLSPIFVLNR